MKKLLMMLCVGALCSTSLLAQDDLKPFKFDISLGYAIPGGKGAKGGVLFAFEPKYAVIPRLSVGLRGEVAVVARGSSSDFYSSSDVEVKASASYLATTDYYFTDNYNFRPFAGGGAGIYSLAGATVSDNEETYTSSARTTFGGMVRGGFETRHFRLGVEYNLVPQTNYTDYYGTGSKITTKNGYLGIKVGICIGGGPR